MDYIKNCPRLKNGGYFSVSCSEEKTPAILQKWLMIQFGGNLLLVFATKFGIYIKLYPAGSVVHFYRLLKPLFSFPFESEIGRFSTMVLKRLVKLYGSIEGLLLGIFNKER